MSGSCLDSTIWSSNTTEPERAFSTFAGLFLLLLIFHSAPSRHRYFGTHAVSGVKDPLAKACGAQFAGCDKHPAAPLVSHPIGTPLHSWSLPHRHSAAPPGPHPSSLPPAKSWCPGHSIVAGLGGAWFMSESSCKADHSFQMCFYSFDW